MDVLLLAGYIMGWLWCVWYMFRVFNTDLGIDDLFEFLMALFLGGLVGLFWPIVAACRLTYIGWVRYMPEFALDADRLFPEIEAPKTRKERMADKLAKREEELAKREKWVMEREKELA